MGKKNRATKYVLKVAGAKSLQAKKKAKVVKTKLKDMKIKVKEQVDKIDKDLVSFRETLHQCSASKKPPAPAASKTSTKTAEASASKDNASDTFVQNEADKQAMLQNMDKFNLKC